MRVHLALAATTAMIATLGAPPLALSQSPAPASAEAAQQQASPAQLDQMLAPIALYPDDLLAQILMAAGYPLEVVQAERWIQDPANAALGGDDLLASVDQQAWDPSVKSLVPFPRILAMMDANLDWTESLGEAFITDQSAVMDSVQRLRRAAEAAGELGTNAQQVVTDQDGEIIITQASPQTVFVPQYEPTVVYGPWPYPGYPPDYFPGYFDNCVSDDFGYCWLSAVVIAPLWGWDHWDWAHHRINLDGARFAAINGGRAPLGGGVWLHDPSHRHDVPYQQPATRDRLQGASVPSQAPRAARGYPSETPEPASPSPRAEPAAAPVSQASPTFESFGRGQDVRIEAERGQASRASAPSYAPSAGGGFHGGMSSGRGRR